MRISNGFGGFTSKILGGPTVGWKCEDYLPNLNQYWYYFYISANLYKVLVLLLQELYTLKCHESEQSPKVSSTDAGSWL